MDKRKFIITLMVLFWAFQSGPGYCGEDLKKPMMQMPQVTISGADEYNDLPALEDDVRLEPASFEETARSKKNKAQMGFVSAAYGSFNSQLYELSQADRGSSIFYSAQLHVNDSNGERDNSEFTVFRPAFEFGIPDKSNDDEAARFTLSYFDKDMGLPGMTTAPTPNTKRRNNNLHLAAEVTRLEGDYRLLLRPYYEASLIDNDASVTDYRHKVSGMRVEFAPGENSFNADIYQNRLEDFYERMILNAELRLTPMDLNDSWQFIYGANIYMQEEFGQRPAPFFELIYRRDEDTLHKVTVTREFEPLIFSKTYLDDNYVEISLRELRPRRKSGISYQVDKYISREWRASLLFYMRQDKDIWFWNDADSNGLYSPSLIEKANFGGMTFSTEYTWNEDFSHFFSLNLRKIRSKDSNYEFFPFEPKQKISLGINYRIDKKYKLNLVGEYFGRRYYRGDSKESSSGYFLLGSKLSYEFKDYLTFYVLIDNLLNDHYEVVRGYPNQSRSVLSGMTVRF